ncbi:luciferase-like monooxygenase family protein [Mycobacterium avium subsp. avium 2285 (R)]|nr:luciferase-like monooxygenase family protein [Mycobacterium avium subsp. avium 2285 (R)]
MRRWGWLITAIDDEDPQRAIREARQQIAFYLTVRTYDSLVALHGWEDAVEAIRKAFRSGRADSMAEYVTDEMLAAIAICGDTAQARDMLAARTELPEIGFVAPPSFLVGRRRRAGYNAAAIRFCGGLS